MMKKLFSLVPFLVFTFNCVFAQEVIPLYPGQIPNSKIEIKPETDSQEKGLIRKVLNPTLEVYLPEKDKSTGAAVIICPGGGYAVIVYEGEGIKTAKEFAKNGVTAFVLKYRLPDDSTMVEKKIGPLQDALQAIKVVRENAEKWGIDSEKIGIMGFSAGGHLASTVATHFDWDVLENKEKTNLRPNFAILVYPVISMQDSLTHLDSRRKLLGNHPSKEIVDEFSNELQVTQQTPPTYLTHAGDDKLVDVENSIVFYQALIDHNVPAEMHLFPKGNHGFVLFQPIEVWVEPILNWMQTSGWIGSK